MFISTSAVIKTSYETFEDTKRGNRKSKVIQYNDQKERKTKTKTKNKQTTKPLLRKLKVEQQKPIKNRVQIQM